PRRRRGAGISTGRAPTSFHTISRLSHGCVHSPPRISLLTTIPPIEVRDGALCAFILLFGSRHFERGFPPFPLTPVKHVTLLLGFSVVLRQTSSATGVQSSQATRIPFLHHHLHLHLRRRPSPSLVISGRRL